MLLTMLSTQGLHPDVNNVIYRGKLGGFPCIAYSLQHTVNSRYPCEFTIVLTRLPILMNPVFRGKNAKHFFWLPAEPKLEC